MKRMAFLVVLCLSFPAFADKAGSKIPLESSVKVNESNQDYTPETDIWPTDNPKEWNFIISGDEKCWYHTKTLKKACEKVKVK